MQMPLNTIFMYAVRRFATSGDAVYSHTFKFPDRNDWIEAVPARGHRLTNFKVILHSYGEGVETQSRNKFKQLYNKITKRHHAKAELTKKDKTLTRRQAVNFIQNWETHRLNDLIQEPEAQKNFKGLLGTQLVTSDPTTPFSAPLGRAVSLSAESKASIQNYRFQQRPDEMISYAEAGVADIANFLQKIPPQRPKGNSGP